MVPLREWLRPPKSLLLILVLLSLVSVSAVGWFGFKLLEQDRMVQAQRRQERLEQAADRIAATLRGSLAETGERSERLADGAAARGQTGRRGAAHRGTKLRDGVSRGRLLYYPAASDEPEAPAEVFAEGELLEFLQAQPAKAADAYRVLAESKNARDSSGSAAAAGARAGQAGASRRKPRGVHAPGGDRRRAGGGSAGRTGGPSCAGG